MQTSVAVAYHSTYGHTAKQAEAVAKGAEQVPGTAVDRISLAGISDRDWELLDRADAIIFGSPTYMSSASADFRAFAQATSKVWADNLRWRDKIAAGFTNSGSMSGDKLHTLVEMALLASQHGMVWVGLDVYGGWNTSEGTPGDPNRLGSWLGAMSQANNDESPESAPVASDLATAEILGARVARIARLHQAGGAYLAENPAEGGALASSDGR
ncbi:flavodoxin family protein [Streptomonospora sediminis]